MPAPPLSNNNEGGTDTTTITTGNSGGASGNAWSAVTIGASATLTFSTTQKRDLLSAQFVEPATGAQTFLAWTGLGAGANALWGRVYIYRTANPAVQKYRLFNVRTTADAQSAGFYVDTAGKLGCENAASGVIAALNGATAMSLSQWVRIEFRVISSTTVGEAEWWLYNTPDSTTASEHLNATGQVLGATSDAVRLGHTSGTPPASETSWMDDMALSTTGALGPTVTPPAPFQAHLPFMR